MTLPAFFFIVAFVAAGYGFTLMLDIDLTVEERVSYGTVLGAMSVTVVGFLLSWWADLTGGTVFATALVVLALSAGGYRLKRAELVAEWQDFGRRLRSPITAPGNPIPFLVLVGLGAIVSLRILGAAYATGSDGGITAGHLSTFGDWSAHLGYAASFAEAQNFPPELPTAAGDSFAYHFGVDFFSALFMPLGMHVTTALQVSSGVLAFAFPAVMYCATLRFSGSRLASVLAVLIFTLAGGMGAWDHFLFEGFADGGIRNIFDLDRSYAFDGFQNQWIDNPVTGFLYPQRPTLIGFPVVLMGLAWLWQARASTERSPRTRLALGLVIGIMPLFHIFAFGVLLVMTAWFALLEFDMRYRAGILASAWVAGVVMVANQVTDASAPAQSTVFPIVAALLVVAAAAVWLSDTNVQLALAIGAAIGLLAVVHIAVVVAVAALAFATAVFEKHRDEILLFVPAVAIGLPLVLWQLPKNSGVLEPNHSMWMLGINTGQDAQGQPVAAYERTIGGFFSFWWNNTGFFIPLVAIAMVWFASRALSPAEPPAESPADSPAEAAALGSRSLGVALLPIWGLLLIPNVAILHFWEGNNVKYVVFFLLLGAPLIGALLADAVKQVPWTVPVVGLLVFTLTLSGGLDVLRAASGEVTDQNGVTWPVGYFTGGDVIVGEWVAKNTPNDAIFVAAPNNAHPVRSLAGRTVVAGSLGRIRDLGTDWAERNEDTRLVLGGFEGFDGVLSKYDVDYVIIGRDELNPNIGGASQQFWDDRAPVVFDLGGYRIYDVRAITAAVQ